jgi:hypothetical protein
MDDERDDVRKKRGYGGLDIDDEPEETERRPSPLVRPTRPSHEVPAPPPPRSRGDSSLMDLAATATGKSEPAPPTGDLGSLAGLAASGARGPGALAGSPSGLDALAAGHSGGGLDALAAGRGRGGLEDLAGGVTPHGGGGLDELVGGGVAPQAPWSRPTHPSGGLAALASESAEPRRGPGSAPAYRPPPAPSPADSFDALAEPWQPPRSPTPPTASPRIATSLAEVPLASAADQLAQLVPSTPDWESPASSDDELELAAPRVATPPPAAAAEELELAQPPPRVPPAEPAVPLTSSADLLAELSSAQAAAAPSWQDAASDDSLELAPDVPVVRTAPQGTLFGEAAAPAAGLELGGDGPVAREVPQGTMFGEGAAPAAPLPGSEVLGDAGLVSGKSLELPALTSGVFPAISDEQVAALTPPPPPVEAGQELAAARDFFVALDKTVKQLNLYEGRGDACARALDGSFGLLTALLARGKLVLKPTPFEFLVGDEPVYTCQEDKSGLSYRLFRDGMRELTLVPGLERWELVELVEIMRSARGQGDEADSVTLLWDRDLPHVRYQAIDLFVEGIFDEGGILQQQAEELMAICEAPVHATAGKAEADRLRAEVFARIEPARHEQAKAWRRERVAALQGLDAAIGELREQGASLGRESEDLWRRAVAMLGRMIAAGAKAERVSALLAGILEDLWKNERWETLVTASRALRALTGDGSDRRLAAAVGEATLHLSTRERILSMAPLLERCSLGQLGQLAELFAILPATANPHLVQLLVAMPPGEVQERFAAILGERRADLTDFYRKRLKSQNLAHVLAAVAALKLVPTALPLLRALLAHPHPKVRLEAIRALERELGENDVPALVGCLALEHRELQEHCVLLLGRIPGRRYIGKLLEQVKAADFEEWPPHRRRRTLQLVVQWGGTEANDFIVKRIIAMNPLRRSKIEIARQDMIAAVQATGGPRAKKIFEACLASRPSEAVREAITAALAGMGT